MIKLFFSVVLFLHTSIYTIHFNTVDGNDTPFNSFAGKKILIVNIATGSAHVGQLAKLQQLYQQYHTSLEIIAFPSNSFGNEARTNAQVKQFCQENYNATFTIAQKGSVTGDSVQPIYTWLANQYQNGVTNIPIPGDFQKVLIDENGEIMGIYAPEVDPMSTVITNAVASDINSNQVN